jgi:hypothetical protein
VGRGYEFFFYFFSVLVKFEDKLMIVHVKI